MSDTHMPSQPVPPAGQNPTEQMPVVGPSAPPPQGMPPKKGMPGWAWALIGGVTTLALGAGLFGAYTMGKQANQNSPAEATSTVSLAASATPTSTPVATSTSVATADDGSSGDSADSGSSGGSTDSGASSDSGSSGDSGSGSSSTSDSGSDSSASSGSESSDSESADPVYHSVLKRNGNSDYVSAPIRLDPGHMKLTVVVTRTNHRPLSARYRKGSSAYVTWWATPNAVAGQSRTTEMDVTSRALYQFRVNCEPGAAWSLRVMWKP